MHDPSLRQLDDDLQILLCPHCGYSLEGLPPEGTCPECGRGYDQRQIILHGWGSGTHASLSTATPTRLAWGGAALVLYAVNLATLPRWMGVAGLAILYSGVFSIVDGLLLLWQRAVTRHRPGLVQVRIDAAGCLQDDELDTRSLPATALRVWSLLRLPALAGVLAVMIADICRASWTTRVVAAGAAAATTFVIETWIRLRRGRQRLTAVTLGDILPAPAPATPTRWFDVKDVRVDPARNGRHRLRITIKNAKGLASPDAVDAELTIGATCAALLSARIDAWRHQAPASGPQPITPSPRATACPPPVGSS